MPAHQQRTNTAILYEYQPDRWSIYAQFEDYPQMIFYWNNEKSCQSKKPIFRGSRQEVSDCSITNLDWETVTFNIKGRTQTLFWIEKTADPKRNILRRANYNGVKERLHKILKPEDIGV